MNRFVVTAAGGTETALRHELAAFGIEQVVDGRGALAFDGEWLHAARACVSSRVGQKVLVELASFEAASEAALVEQLSALPFEEHLDERTTFAIEAHLIRAPLDHTLYASQRVKDVVVDRMRARGRGRPSVDVRMPKVRFVLHWDGARVSFSKDVVGVPLFKRGYRREQGEAPMKETLAAAILAIVHADVARPFLDPCCGSGTIAIEQALRMLDRAPSIGRHFAFERWPTTDDAMRAAIAEARAEAKARAKKKPDAPIRLSDWHPKAIAAAEANIAAAGLGTWLQVERVDARKVLPPGDRPVVVTNLPFGERLGGDKKLQLEGFYRTLGAHLSTWAGARLAFFSSQRDAQGLLGIPGRPRRWGLSSGALDATLLRYDLDGRSDPAAG